jgi:hypothetical protein
MSTLNTRPQEVFGGMQWLKIAPVEAFSALTYSYDYKPASYTLNGGYSWIDIYSTLETISFVEEDITGPLGEAWHQEVSCFLPGKLGGIEISFENYKTQRWIVAANDWDDRLTVIGSLTNGCKLKIKYNSQGKVSGLKGRLFTFYRDDRHHTRDIAKAVLF